MKSPRNASKQTNSRQQKLLSPQAQSALPCCCDVDAVELDITQAVASKETSAEGILNLVRQAVIFWSRLRNCQACREARIEDLLAAFELAISFLSQAGTAHVAADAHHIPHSWHGVGSAPNCPPPSAYNRPGYMMRATPPVGHWDDAIPSMSLGEHTLDLQQSMVLLRSAYGRVSGQIASALYEMRRMESSFAAKVNGTVGDLLYSALNLVEAFTDDHGW